MLRTLTYRFVILLAIGALGAALGCDSGFGQPCAIPQTESFRRACNVQATGEEEAAENEIQMESYATCAVRNFAGCATRICLVYKGSDAFCTEQCSSDTDCPGDAVCLPLIGDVDQMSSPCTPTEAFTPECYCVRSGAVGG